MDIETEIETTLIKKVNGKKHNIFKIPKKICFQTDLHLANFSHANGTFRW